MKRMLLFVFLFLSTFSFSQDVPIYQVIPNSHVSTAGGLSFLGPLSNATRRYQWLISSSELTSFVGKEIKGITYRLLPSATAAWPASEITYSQYDFYLSGCVDPSNRSLTFTANVVGDQVQVRTGPQTFPANSFPFGGSPNEFGAEVVFTSPYLYTGGNLLVELRHTGFTGTSSSVDAIGTSGPGYGTLISCLYASNLTNTTGTAGNFSIIRLTADNPVPVELVSFKALPNGNSVLLNWETATELNNKGFQVERKSLNKWENVAFITGAGTTTEKRYYSFTDNNLTSGNYSYRLKQIDFDGTINLSKEIEVDVYAPGEFILAQNYPNPFNPSTVINFAIPEKSFVTLKVVNLLGEEAAVLVNKEMEAGKHSVNFNASSLSNGVYIYQLQSNGNSISKKMILTK